MEPTPGPSLREWIIIIVVFLVFVWIPILFIGVGAHKPYLLYREPPPPPVWGMRSEAVSIAGRELVFYYFDYRRHTFAYFPIVVQDGSEVRYATYAEFIVLESRLRPHKEAE